MARYATPQVTEKRRSNTQNNIPFSDLLDLIQGKNPYRGDKYSSMFGGGGGYQGGSGPASGSFRGAQEAGGYQGGGSPSFWSQLFGGGGGAAAGGSTGLGSGATMTSMYGLPAAGSTSLAGTTGGAGAGAGAGGAAGMGAAAGPLALFTFGMMFALDRAKKHSKELKEYRASPAGIAAGIADRAERQKRETDPAYDAKIRALELEEEKKMGDIAE